MPSGPREALMSRLRIFTNSLQAVSVSACSRSRVEYTCRTASHRSVATEGDDEAHSNTTLQPSSSQSIDRRMILLLRRNGAQTMEDLAALTGVGWERVLFSVDRLSRMGKVSLTLVRPCEYRVSAPAGVR